MASAYSQDLRDRVIDAVIRGGMSRRAAAARFGVSESSAIKWVQRFERSGSRAASRMGGYLRPKLEPHLAWPRIPSSFSAPRVIVSRESSLFSFLSLATSFVCRALETLTSRIGEPGATPKGGWCGPSMARPDLSS
jgi:Homeodomain-like domain